jgi:hypothetical protein
MAGKLQLTRTFVAALRDAHNIKTCNGAQKTAPRAPAEVGWKWHLRRAVRWPPQALQASCTLYSASRLLGEPNAA